MSAKVSSPNLPENKTASDRPTELKTAAWYIDCVRAWRIRRFFFVPVSIVGDELYRSSRIKMRTAPDGRKVSPILHHVSRRAWADIGAGVSVSSSISGRLLNLRCPVACSERRALRTNGRAAASG